MKFGVNDKNKYRPVNPFGKEGVMRIAVCIYAVLILIFFASPIHSKELPEWMKPTNNFNNLDHYMQEILQLKHKG